MRTFPSLLAFLLAATCAAQDNPVTNGGFETAGTGGADIWGTWTETAGDGALFEP